MRTYINKYLFLFLAIALSSCEDYLDKEPYNQPVQETYWKTSKDVESALNGAYALLRAKLNDKVAYYTYGDVPSDEFIFAGFEDYDNIRRYSLGQRLNQNDAYRVLVHLRDWTGFYQVINHTNMIIKKTAAIPDAAFDSEEERENMLGEAYFIRGFTYFYMSRIWGDVPLITEAIDDPVNQPYVARSPKEEVWKQIEQDLLMASDKMSWGYNQGGNRAVRGSKGVTLAALAHFYAWTGTYEKTITVTDSLIQNGSYSLVSGEDYKSIFNQITSENIFQINMQLKDEEEFTEDGEFTIGRKLLKAPFTVRQFQVEPEWKMDVGRFRSLFNVNETSMLDSVPDLRLRKVFRDISSFVPITIKYDNTGYEFPEQQRNFYVSNDIIIFRYADILLLRAEALAATGRDGDASLILDEVRARAGLAPYKEGGSVLMAVMEERARELFAEGQRFYDMVRLKRKMPEFQIPFINDADFDGGKYYWPVDPLLRTNDPELEQTEFWKSQM